MKKLFAVLLAALTVWAVYAGYTNKEVEAQGNWGANAVYFSKPTVIADTTSLTTYKTIVNTSGQGIVYRILFNNSANNYDPSVIINIDGYIDTLTEASSEELTRYIARAFTPTGTGLDKWTQEGDSTNAANMDLNVYYKNNFSVKIKSENAGGTTRCTVIYGKR